MYTRRDVTTAACSVRAAAPRSTHALHRARALAAASACRAARAISIITPAGKATRHVCHAGQAPPPTWQEQTARRAPRESLKTRPATTGRSAGHAAYSSVAEHAMRSHARLPTQPMVPSRSATSRSARRHAGVTATARFVPPLSSRSQLSAERRQQAVRTSTLTSTLRSLALGTSSVPPLARMRRTVDRHRC